MEKNINKRVGYLIIIVLLMSPFFINEVQATQTNCSDYTTPLLFNYSIELRNSSTNGELIDYATCRITTSEGIINGSLMLNNGGGDYTCPFSTAYNTGPHSANITCDILGSTTQLRGIFEIPPDDVPLSIILFLIGVSFLFIFYGVKLEEQFIAIRGLMFLYSFLVFFIIFVILFPIISEEGGTDALVSLSENIFAAYSIIFTAIVLFTILMLGLHVLSFWTNRKRGKQDEGVVF